MKPTFFATPAEFRAWLKQHHQTADELIVGYYRKDSGRPSITWPESVDEALCFGWIDGIRRKVSDVAYTIRFTPRRATSNWSAINIARVAELTKLKRVQPAGHYEHQAGSDAAAPPGQGHRRVRAWPAQISSQCVISDARQTHAS